MLILYGCTAFADNNLKEKIVNRMAIRWEVLDDRVHFELSTPEHGWVAIGFNKKNELGGTHLVMACVKDGRVIGKDYYIQSPGIYQPITELGAKGIVYDLEGDEGFSGTMVRFSLPLNQNGKYYIPLIEGKEYNLLVAYSREDDFSHHSMMRNSLKIKL